MGKKLKFVYHPSQPSDRGISQAVSQTLRFAGLQVEEAALIPLKVRVTSALHVAHEANGLWIWRLHRKEVQMKSDHMRGCLVSHMAGYQGAPIAALNAVP